MQGNHTMSVRRTVRSSSSSSHGDFGRHHESPQQGDETHFSNLAYRYDPFCHNHGEFYRESSKQDHYPTVFGSKNQQASSIVSAPPSTTTSVPPVARARRFSSDVDDEESIYQSMLKYQKEPTSSQAGFKKGDLLDLQSICGEESESDMDRKLPAKPLKFLSERRTRSLVSPKAGISSNKRTGTTHHIQDNYKNIVQVLRHDVLTIPGEIDRRETTRREAPHSGIHHSTAIPHRHDHRQQQQQQQHQICNHNDNHGMNDLAGLRTRRSENRHDMLYHQEKVYETAFKEKKHQENPAFPRKQVLHQRVPNDLIECDDDYDDVVIEPYRPARTLLPTDPSNNVEDISKKQLQLWKEIQEEQERKQLEQALTISREEHQRRSITAERQSIHTIGINSGSSKSNHTKTVARDYLIRNDPQRITQDISSADFMISQQLAIEELEVASQQQQQQQQQQKHLSFAPTAAATATSTTMPTTSRYKPTALITTRTPRNDPSNDVFLNNHDSFLRGHKETNEAISRGESHVVRCAGCSARLHVPTICSLVYCPTCHTVSPGQNIDTEGRTCNSDEDRGSGRRNGYHPTNSSAPLRRSSR